MKTREFEVASNAITCVSYLVKIRPALLELNTRADREGQPYKRSFHASQAVKT
jgi:hypothetical protein